MEKRIVNTELNVKQNARLVTRGHKTLGFKWYAKRIARWQGLYRLIGSSPRNPQRFYTATVMGYCKKKKDNHL